jgi:pimeloyl-ACP methyl ester carboxylesterase
VSVMQFVLIAGLWLDPTAWDRVTPGLRGAGHESIAVMLPGQGDGRTDATLEDQIDAVVAAIDATEGPVIVVGHSAACTLAWIAADRRPDRVIAVAMIGGFPADDGRPYAGFFEPTDGMVRFPGWQAFEGPDSADLDAEAREQIHADAIPVPATVTQALVSLTDPQRYEIPVTLICPEFSVADAQTWIAGGEVPALTRATDLRYVDIDSGHWPMFTQPDQLAEILAEL